MALNSFRLRIALLSALLAGGALVSFAIMSWWLIYQTKLNRIDDGIKNQLMVASDRPKPKQKQFWQLYANTLPSLLSATDTNLALLVQNSAGTTLYQSAHWTKELTQNITFPSPPPAPFLTPGDLTPTSENSPPRRPPEQPRPFPPPDHPPPNHPPPDHPPPGYPPPRQPPEHPFEQPPRPPHPSGSHQPKPKNPDVFPLPSRLSRPVTQSTQTGSWRVGTATGIEVRLAIAINLQTIKSEMNSIRNIYLFSIPLLLVLIAIGAWWVSGRALKPIDEVTETLRAVTAKGLDQRVPTHNSDQEFVELLQVFNQMMERLERSFTQASRFSADAAHELKTPLSILQGELERSIQEAESGSELQQRLSRLLDEVRRLSTIVRKLLLLSLADAGQMRLHRTAVDLSEMLRDLVSDIEILSPDLKVKAQIEGDLVVKADQALLIQVLQNLITNAVKYNLPQGWIRLEARRNSHMVLITVTNSSKDIPIQEQNRIFERFHRGSPDYTHQIEGLGLGLSLSREIALAHGGNLTLDPTPKGQTAFTLTLPA